MVKSLSSLILSKSLVFRVINLAEDNIVVAAIPASAKVILEWSRSIHPAILAVSCVYVSILSGLTR